MSTFTRVNQQVSARWNRSLTLQLLRKHGPLSRRQLSQMTGLRGSTLTYIVRELLDKRIVRTAGKRAARRVGQKQILLEVNPELGYTVGFDLRPGVSRMAIRDAGGRTLDVSPLATEGPLDRLPKVLRTGLEQRLMQLRDVRGDLLGVGVGLPGMVDAQRGMVLYSRPFEVQNLPLRDLLAVAFEATPVLCVDHNANYAALAEAREGAARHFSHFVYFLIGDIAARTYPPRSFKTFGTALFLDGRLYHGVHFGAGELDGNLAPQIDAPIGLAELERLGDATAALTPALEAMAQGIGRCVASILNLLDPQAVIIGSNHGVANEAFLDRLRQEVTQFMLPLQGRLITIAASTLGDPGVALGAAIAAADQSLFELPAPVADQPVSVGHLNHFAASAVQAGV